MLVRLLKTAPGMPTTEMERTLRHYTMLGFTATMVGEEFSILERDEVELHFSLSPDHDPQRTAVWIYVFTDDVEGLHEELRAGGMEGLRDVRTTDYGMREFAHIDPDNNLILYGSRVASARGDGS